MKKEKKNEGSPSLPYGNHGYYIPLSRNIFPLKIEKTLGLQKRATSNRTHPKKKKKERKRKKKRKEKVKKFTVRKLTKTYHSGKTVYRNGACGVPATDVHYAFVRVVLVY